MYICSYGDTYISVCCCQVWGHYTHTILDILDTHAALCHRQCWVLVFTRWDRDVWSDQASWARGHAYNRHSKTVIFMSSRNSSFDCQHFKSKAREPFPADFWGSSVELGRKASFRSQLMYDWGHPLTCTYIWLNILPCYPKRSIKETARNDVHLLCLPSLITFYIHYMLQMLGLNYSVTFVPVHV